MAASAEETNKRIDGDKNEKSDDEASKIPSNQNNESYNASRPPPRSYCHIGWTTIPDLLDELDNKDKKKKKKQRKGQRGRGWRGRGRGWRGGGSGRGGSRGGGQTADK